MSLFGGSKVRIDSPRLAGIQLSAAGYARPVPIVYGTTRVPASIIDYDDFTAVSHETRQTAGGGLSGSTIIQTNYTYTAMVLLGLCEGPISGINVVWADKDISSLAAFGFSLFDGAIGQAVWGYLSTHHPSKAIGYSGTAYVASGPIDLGNTGSLKNFTFEVQGLLVGGSGGIAGQDAEPCAVIDDFLTNQYYGAGMDPARIQSMAIGQSGTVASSYQRYCQALGFFVSPAFLEQRPAREHLAEILQATNAGAVVSEGLLKIYPFGDQSATGNGVTFTPYNTVLYALTPDHLLPLSKGGDLIKVTRRSLEESFNTIPVEFMPRSTVGVASDYNTDVVQDPDPVDTANYGQRQGASLTLHAITRRDHALLISRIAAQRSVYVRNQYTFRLPWRYIGLDPMDLVSLTDPKFGLLERVVRIISIDEDEQGALTLVAEEWPFGVATGTLYDTQENDGVATNTAADPGNALAPLIFDVPMLYSANAGPEMAICTAGGALWGGCEVWRSFDGTTYELVGTITKKSPMGVTTGALAAGTGFDTTHSVGVDLSASGGRLSSDTDQGAQALLDLCYLGGELLSPAQASLTSAFNYTLSRIQRGAYGTGGSAHLSGVAFARLTDAMFRMSIPENQIGSTVYVKLVSFNIYGGGRQDIASVPVYTHVPTALGIDPPYPATVALSLSGTAPGSSTPNTVRQRLVESSMVMPATPDDPGYQPPQYATIDWSAVDIYPASYLSGYEVAIYSGSDPNDESKYVGPLVQAPAGAISAVLNLPADYSGSLTLNAAVRALYGTDPSSWRTSSGSVVLSPATQPLNLGVVLELTQTASTRDTVTFSVTPHDPLNRLVSATCQIAWAGLTGVLDNGTGLPVGSTKSMAFGSSYSFTATLNAQFRGAGYVKFRLPAAGRGDGYAVWLAAQSDQDAAPATELAMDNAGATSIVVNAPDNTATLKWLASTSGYPSPATVAASGTVASGGSPFMIALGITAALGETVYFTGVPFDVFGTAGQTIQCQKYRETVIASKTIQFSAAQFVPYAGALGTQFYYPSSGEVANKSGYGPGFDAAFVLPDNCEITEIAAEIWQEFYSPFNEYTRLDLYALPFAGVIASLDTTAAAAAWVTLTASCSQSTTGIRFNVSATCDDVGGHHGDGVQRLRSVSITYSSPNTEATV